MDKLSGFEMKKKRNKKMRKMERKNMKIEMCMQFMHNNNEFFSHFIHLNEIGVSE